MAQAGNGATGEIAKGLATAALAAAWSRRSPRPLAPAASLSPSDSLQRTMNLIMPLRFPTLLARGELARVLFEASDQIVAGLNTVGTVHFARFDIVAGNLCMFSVYDGEFSSYIRDFIAAIGSGFDAILGCVKGPPSRPVSEHVDEFVDWVRRHDAFQMPEFPTGILTGRAAGVQRDTLVALHRNPNVQLATYSAYPGYSVAQIRDRLGVGW